MDKHVLTAEEAQEFHRRMAGIIEAVQAGIWKAGAHTLLGHATDFAAGQERGAQTLILKTSSRSSYLRLSWNAILGNTPADRQVIDDAIQKATNELA